MASHTTTVTLNAQLHERIVGLKHLVSEQLRFNQMSLGLGPMLGLLLDHWEHAPPDFEWLKAQAELYPKRGRPRRSEAADMTPRTALRAHTVKGHELMMRKAEQGRPYRTIFCKHCTMQFSTWDFADPPGHCPRAGFSTLFTLKTWTKNELLASGFAEDEVAWCPE